MAKSPKTRSLDETGIGGVGVDEMPLAELRARTHEVHGLLRAAREHVRASVDAASSADVESRIVRLHAIFNEVQTLLPGLVVPGAAARPVAGDDVSSGLWNAGTDDDDPPASLTRDELARAKQILAELKEGMERMDLLESIGSGIDELLGMIEASRAELTRRARAGAST